MLATIFAFARRDLQIALSYRIPFVFEVTGALFVLLEFALLSRIVPGTAVSGGYFSFVTLGLVLSAFLTGVSLLAVSMRQEQVQGTLEATMSTGMSSSALAAGLAAYPLVVAALRGILYVALAVAMGARFPSANWSLGIAALVVGSISFVGVGLVGASFVLAFRQATAATTWILALLTMAAGVFFPLRLLPHWLRWLSGLSPATETLLLLRRAVLEGLGWGNAWPSFILLAGMMVVSVGVGVAALAAGLSWARRSGGLAQY